MNQDVWCGIKGNLSELTFSKESVGRSCVVDRTSIAQPPVGCVEARLVAAAPRGFQGWLRRCPSGMVTAGAHRRVHRQRRRRRSMPLVLSVSPFSPCAAATMASRTLLARQAQHIHCVRSLLFLMTHPCSETSTAHETRVTCASQSDCSWSLGSGLFQLRS